MRARLEQADVEQRLPGIWAEVLGCEPPRPQDDFFALGGNSLGAVELAARTSAAFGVEVPATAVFGARTVAAYASVVLERDGAPARGAARPARHDREALAPWEATVWAWAFYGSGIEAQSVDAFVLEGPLDVAALERAASDVVRRHEILRTVYPEVACRPRARVLPAAPVRIPLTDLARGAHRRRGDALRRELARLRAEPLDYRIEPPLRLHLLRLEAERHVLAVAVHEIVCDGQGYVAFLRDLARRYDEHVGAAAADAAPPPLQYRDAIHLRHDADAAAGDRHWERVLREAPLALPLPFPSGGRVSGTEPFGGDERAAAALTRDLAAGLGALAAQEAATPFMAYAAAYALLLHRWTGEREVVLESSAANRARADLQDVVGMFARMLPFPVDVGDEPSFRTLLRRMRDTALTAFHYADRLPVVDALQLLDGIPGLSGRSPYFRLRDPAQEPLLRLARIAARRLERDEPSGALHGEVRLRDDGSAELAISSNLPGWAPGELDGMARCFVELLTAAVAQPDRPIGSLGPQGRPATVRDATGPDGDAERLHELVERRAREDPRAIAVRAPDETLDYGTLDARAQEVALRLRAAGTGSGVAVPIPLEPSAHALVTALAALKAGATCMVGGADDAPGGARPVPAVDAPEGAQPVSADGAPGAQPVPTDALAGGDVAFLIATAGVTGAPRWIALRHEQLVRHALRQRAACRLGPHDVALHTAGPGVRAWALSPWPYLAAGAQVVVAPAAGAEPPAAPAAEITVAGLAPAEASRWLAAPRARRPRLRLVRAQGHGALSLPDARALDGVSVVREYAVSEAGGVVLTERARGSTDAWAGVAAGPGEIGAPLVVLDDYGNVAADGAVGELAIGAGAVRTGDVGRRRADGTVEFLGRRADEARFRGFRLNPCMQLVEEALGSHPAVAAAVAAWEPQDGALVAVAVPRRGALPTRGDLDRWLLEHQSGWLLPARYLAVEAIPRRADGSPDRPALARRAHAARVVRRGPATPTERALLKVWRRVLGRRRIGVEENFFALGGTFVHGVELARRAAEAGVGYETNALFILPTIAGLAALIDSERAAGGGGGSGQP